MASMVKVKVALNSVNYTVKGGLISALVQKRGEDFVDARSGKVYAQDGFMARAVKAAERAGLQQNAEVRVEFEWPEDIPL